MRAPGGLPMQSGPAGSSPADATRPGSSVEGSGWWWSTDEKMEFDVLAFARAAQLADERKCPASHAEMPAVVLDATDLLERLLVEVQLVPGFFLQGFDQPRPAVVPEQIRVDSGQLGRRIEREE